MKKQPLGSLPLILVCLAFPADDIHAQPAEPQQPVPEATEQAAPGPSGAELPEPEGAPKRIQIDLNQVLAQARAAFRAGNYDEAVKLYQLILRFVPESRVVRIELSFALAALGQRERSVRLLRDLDTEGLDPEVITAIDRILGPKKLQFFAIPELILDSNINGQTQKDVILINGVPFTLSEDAKGRDGFGYGLTLGAAYRLVDEGPRTTATAGVRVRDLTGREDDETQLFGSLSFAFEPGERTAVTPAISGVYRTKAGDPYELEGAASLTGAFDIGSVRTTLSGRYRLIAGEGDFKDLRDREWYQASASFAYGFTSLATRFDGRAFREDWTETNTQDNEGFSTGLDFIFVKTPWVRPTIGGTFTFRHYDEEAPFFNVVRLDREYQGHLELLFRDIDLFGTGAPAIRYRYTRATSNVPLFDYDRHELSFAVRVITF